jgi:hypothetical protein
MTTPQLCYRHRVEPSPQTSDAKGLETENIAYSICGGLYSLLKMNINPQYSSSCLMFLFVCLLLQVKIATGNPCLACGQR